MTSYLSKNGDGGRAKNLATKTTNQTNRSCDHRIQRTKRIKTELASFVVKPLHLINNPPPLPPHTHKYTLCDL